MATTQKPNDKIGLKKVLTPKFRVSFPAVFKPKAFDAKSEPKFSVVMLFDKNEKELSKLRTAIVTAMTEKWGSKDKWPKNWKNPLRDGDEKSDTEGYKGTIFVTASSKQKPGVVDSQVQPIISEAEFYAGCYARATIIAYTFDHLGNRGVGFSLQNLQKLDDGEPFSGRRAPEDEFEAVDNGSNSKENFEDSDDLEDDMGL